MRTFSKENVALISFQSNAEGMENKYFVMRDEFSKNPEVISVSGAYTVPGLHNKEQQSVSLKDAPPDEM